ASPRRRGRRWDTRARSSPARPGRQRRRSERSRRPASPSARRRRKSRSSLRTLPRLGGMAVTTPTVISFARGVPAPDCLAVDELAECARAVIERDGRTILSYGSGAGYAPLRSLIGERFGVPPSRVVLTNGSLNGFVLLAQRLARGQTVF